MKFIDNFQNLQEGDYVFNYDNTGARKILRIGVVNDGELYFVMALYPISDGIYASEYFVHEGSGHHLVEYQEVHFNAVDDFNYLMSREEVLKHVLMEEI